MNRFVLRLRQVAEALSALMMTALFATFLLQIFSRYVMDEPFGWTLELCLILWVWIVFFGAAFILRSQDHITFDLLYLAVPAGPRRVMAAVSALVVAGALLWSLLPTWDWVSFLRIKKSATLHIPMRDIYIVYPLFVVAVAATYLWRIWTLLRHGVEEDRKKEDAA
ncbi:Tripartite ATP-independent transporter, DctQ component [Ensifer adhaerens]|nr:Tripartite ATP-independent transporter, DctQ component [Ensifer adhaerens]